MTCQHPWQPWKAASKRLDQQVQGRCQHQAEKHQVYQIRT